MAMAKDTGIPLMVSVARMVAKRLYGILNAIKKRVSNGNAESLNSKIQLMRIKSWGFRNKEQLKWPKSVNHFNRKIL
ncbi:transposase [Rouxiella badensis]|uniref:transposase n=1 Tax=Rouxiella badensis TaxID=1646377 RepID=UPI003B8A7883